MGIPMTINLTKLGDSATSSQSMDSTLYRQLLGSWMHLMHTRPDIENAFGLRVTSSSGVMLSGYTDSDWDGSAVDQKSTSGYCFSMGSAMISWSNKKQGSIAQSILLEAMPARKQFGS